MATLASFHSLRYSHKSDANLSEMLEQYKEKEECDGRWNDIKMPFLWECFWISFFTFRVFLGQLNQSQEMAAFLYKFFDNPQSYVVFLVLSENKLYILHSISTERPTHWSNWTQTTIKQLGYINHELCEKGVKLCIINCLWTKIYACNFSDERVLILTTILTHQKRCIQNPLKMFLKPKKQDDWSSTMKRNQDGGLW